MHDKSDKTDQKNFISVYGGWIVDIPIKVIYFYKKYMPLFFFVQSNEMTYFQIGRTMFHPQMGFIYDTVSCSPAYFYVKTQATVM